MNPKAIYIAIFSVLTSLASATCVDPRMVLQMAREIRDNGHIPDMVELHDNAALALYAIRRGLPIPDDMKYRDEHTLLETVINGSQYDCDEEGRSELILEMIRDGFHIHNEQMIHHLRHLLFANKTEAFKMLFGAIDRNKVHNDFLRLPIQNGNAELVIFVLENTSSFEETGPRIFKDYVDVAINLGHLEIVDLLNMFRFVFDQENSEYVTVENPAVKELRMLREIREAMNNGVVLESIYRHVLEEYQAGMIPPAIRLYLVEYFNRNGMSLPEGLFGNDHVTPDNYEYELINQIVSGPFYYDDEERRFEVISQMISDGFNIPSGDLNNLMERYAREGRSGALKSLLDLVGRDRVPYYVLESAIYGHNADTLYTLLENVESFDFGGTGADECLALAIQNQNMMAVEVLMKFAHKLRFTPEVGTYAHDIANETGNEEMVIRINDFFPLEPESGQTPFAQKVYQLFSRGNYGLAVKLFGRLDRNNIYGEILYAVVRNENMEMTKFVLENTERFDFDATGRNADWCIISAINSKNFEMIDLLLSYKHKLSFSNEMPQKINEAVFGMEEMIKKLRETFSE